MKLKVEFPELDTLVRRMGANPSEWNITTTPLDPRRRLEIELEKGIEIPLEEVRPEHGGLLTYKGSHVLLYIMDTRKSRFVLEYETENAPRFHVAECRTLQRMRHEGRYERYVVTIGTDGRFAVVALDPDTGKREELEASLHVCKNCLTTLNYELYRDEGRSTKNRIWQTFSLEDFFGAYSTFFQSVPRHTDQTAPKGGYAPDFARLSYRIRSQRRWTCEQCRVNLERHKRLLHCHHRNGVVSDDSSSNIGVLCAVCHSKQPGHQRMKIGLRAKLIIQDQQREQGLA